MPNQDIAYQYGSAPPTDSTSPIHGADAKLDQKNTGDLKAIVQRQSSQIELLTRELRRTQARVRDLESRLDQTINNIRTN